MNPDIEKDVDSFNDLTKQLFSELIKRRDPRFYDEEMVELTEAQMITGITLSDKGSLTMGELATNIGASLPTVTGIIDRMVKRDLIVRQRDDTDRRVVKVCLTPKGKEQISRFHANKHEQMRPVMALLNQEDRKTFLRILTTMVDEIKKRNSTPSTPEK
jgi:DNA-binding MarR family transcriptional regulator